MDFSAEGLTAGAKLQNMMLSRERRTNNASGTAASDPICGYDGLRLGLRSLPSRFDLSIPELLRAGTLLS